MGCYWNILRAPVCRKEVGKGSAEGVLSAAEGAQLCEATLCQPGWAVPGAYREARRPGCPGQGSPLRLAHCGHRNAGEQRGKQLPLRPAPDTLPALARRLTFKTCVLPALMLVRKMLSGVWESAHETGSFPNLAENTGGKVVRVCC